MKLVFLCGLQMPKLSYAQIAQKSKESSADSLNTDRCVSDFDELPTMVRDVTQSSSVAGLEPRPQRGAAMAADSRPAHSHSHGRQRGGGATHVTAAEDIRHRDYNGVASATRQLP